MAVNKIGDSCCGCTSCYNVCPKNAIKLVYNRRGFVVPEVDEHLCIKCNLCEKVCSACQNDIDLNDVYNVFAAKSIDKKNHRTSQSGGVAYELSKSFLKSDNTIVYGAVFNDNFEVQHRGIDKVNDLHKLQGSKYVQSHLGELFKNIGNSLESKKILFIGTPCQVYGLKKFCEAKKCKMGNLFTCDLVCYGVSSPMIFKEWLNILEQGKKSKLINMCFRDTEDTWGKGREKYIFENGEKLQTKVYMNWYFADMITRSSCDNCKFCNIKRVGDMTLGDFWGIADVLPEFTDEHGVSLVLVNSDKGQYLWEGVKSNINYRSSDIKSAKIAQTRLEPNEKKIDIENKKRFWRLYHKYGLRYMAEENGIFEPRISIKVRWKFSNIKNRLRK